MAHTNKDNKLGLNQTQPHQKLVTHSSTRAGFDQVKNNKFVFEATHSQGELDESQRFD